MEKCICLPAFSINSTGKMPFLAARRSSCWNCFDVIICMSLFICKKLVKVYIFFERREGVFVILMFLFFS